MHFGVPIFKDFLVDIFKKQQPLFGDLRNKLGMSNY